MAHELIFQSVNEPGQTKKHIFTQKLHRQAYMLWSFIILLTFSDAAIVPDIAFVLQGDSPVFCCYKDYHTSVDFQMQFKPFGSNKLRIFYRSEGLNPAYANHYGVSFNDSSGYYYLKIRNVSSSDAGTYICDWGDQPQTAELVVVQPGPVCDSTGLESSTNDTCETEIRFECSVGFDGKFSPAIEFWMVTARDKYALKEDSSEYDRNTAKTVMVKKISLDSNDRFECRLPIVNKRNLFAAQSDCNLGKIRQSCNSSPWKTVHGGEIVASWVILSVLIVVFATSTIIYAIRYSVVGSRHSCCHGFNIQSGPPKDHNFDAGLCKPPSGLDSNDSHTILALGSSIENPKLEKSLLNM